MTQEAGQGPDAPAQTATDELAALREALEKTQAQAEARLEAWQRAQADYQNLRRRSDQDREELARFANAQLILHLLYDRQLAPEQISKILGISQQTVRSLHHKAITKLRRRLVVAGEAGDD